MIRHIGIVKQLAATALFLLANVCVAQTPVSFTVGPAGCAMAHCDARMFNDAATASPSTASLVATHSSAGASVGLGCVSNATFVACTKAANPPSPSNLVIYDANGQIVGTDGGILNSSAWTSVPIMDINGNVIAADDSKILMWKKSTGNVIWQTAKPDAGTPISPVIAGSDASMILLATGTAGGSGTAPELSVWDVGTGALLSHSRITDPSTLKTYHTRNTPAIKGNRAYVVAEDDIDSNKGRLYALDICNTGCAQRGSFTVAWYFDFNGPSGASPLVIGNRIFFDGRPPTSPGRYFCLEDAGGTYSFKWQKTLPNGPVVASVARDSRGGIWLYESINTLATPRTLIRLDETSGATLQTIDVSSVLSLENSYTAASGLTISQTTGGAKVITLAVRSLNANRPNYVAAIDVSSTASGTKLWLFQVGVGLSNIAAGQFPIVVNPQGKRRVVFEGSQSNTYFVGTP